MSNSYQEMKLQKPVRVRHSRVLSINGSPAEVFSLLCPVRELDWAPGWQPDWVISESGFAEPGCVFQTSGDSSQAGRATWVVTDHAPGNGQLEIIKLIPGHTMMRLTASVTSRDRGGAELELGYEYTALGEGGKTFVEECTQEWYDRFSGHFEQAMNAYLASGESLAAA